MAQFTMALVNPDITSGDTSIVYTDATGGNKLNVSLSNQTGESLTITGDLLVKFPKTIMNEDGIKAITVTGSCWQTNGYYTPQTDPDQTSGDGPYFILKLSAQGTGVAFDKQLIINLETLTPVAKGNGQVHANYTFSAERLSMDVAANLGVTAKPSNDKKPLIGNVNALNMSMRVNSGGPTNPLVFTDPTLPVEANNAAQNLIHLNLDFQNKTIPSQTETTETAASSSGDDTLGKLVPSWPAGKPPTFQLQFPYFNDAAPLAPKFALTDDKSQGDEGYNAFTSARNIKLSLSSTDPSTLTNDWWTITPPGNNSNAPFWLVQPTAKNKYVFTGTTQGASSPGPFLDLYFSHVYSNLKIDDQNPETILYIESVDFPGYNDNVLQQTLFKEHSVEIQSFTGSIEITGSKTTLVLSWTTDAREVYISGDSNTQGPVSAGAYRKSIDLTTPLLSEYTLTAVGHDGVSKLERTLAVKWKESNTASPQTYSLPSSISISPDGTLLYLTAEHSLEQLEASSLSSTGAKVDLERDSALNVVASQNKVYLASRTFDGEADITAYDASLRALGQPVLKPGNNAAANLYPMALSEGLDRLALNIALPAAPTPGPSVAAYSASNMTALPSSPFVGTDHSVRGIGLALNEKFNHLYYPDALGLGVLDATTFEPIVNTPVSINSSPTISYYPGPIAVSPDGKTVVTLGLGYKGTDRIFVLCSIDVASLSLKKPPVQVSVGYSNAQFVVSTGVIFSYDGKYVFVFGTDYSENNTTHNTTIMNVYNPDNLSEISWSPITVSRFYGSMVASPDGSRLYANTLETSTSMQGSVRQLVPYF